MPTSLSVVFYLYHAYYNYTIPFVFTTVSFYKYSLSFFYHAQTTYHFSSIVFSILYISHNTHTVSISKLPTNIATTSAIHVVGMNKKKNVPNDSDVTKPYCFQPSTTLQQHFVHVTCFDSFCTYHRHVGHTFERNIHYAK